MPPWPPPSSASTLSSAPCATSKRGCRGLKRARLRLWSALSSRLPRLRLWIALSSRLRHTFTSGSTSPTAPFSPIRPRAATPRDRYARRPTAGICSTDGLRCSSARAKACAPRWRRRGGQTARRRPRKLGTRRPRLWPAGLRTQLYDWSRTSEEIRGSPWRRVHRLRRAVQGAPPRNSAAHTAPP